MTAKRGYETWEKVAAVLGGGNDERELRQWESIRWACSRVGESVRLSGTGADRPCRDCIEIAFAFRREAPAFDAAASLGAMQPRLNVATTLP